VFLAAFRASSADPAHRYLHVLDPGTGGQGPDRSGLGTVFQADVEDLVASGAVEMGVGPEVRAVTGRLAVEVDLADRTRTGEALEAIVDRGQRDRGHPLLRAHEDLGGGGMPLAEIGEDLVDDLTLLGHTQTSEVLGSLRGMGCGRIVRHDGGVYVTSIQKVVWIKNYSK